MVRFDFQNFDGVRRDRNNYCVGDGTEGFRVDANVEGKQALGPMTRSATRPHRRVV